MSDLSNTTTRAQQEETSETINNQQASNNSIPSAINNGPTSPHFSLVSDSPGDLAIAEDDNEIIEITNSNSGSQLQSGNAASREQERSKIEEANDAEIKSSEPKANENAWSDNSPAALQIDEDDSNNREEKNREEEKAAELPNTETTSERQVEMINLAPQSKREEDTHGSGSVVSSTQSGTGIPSAQQSSNDEVIKLMNEQSLRELHEKHDTEQRPSVHSISNPSVIASSGIAAPLIQMPSLDNSKIHMRTLYPLRGGDPVDQLPRIAASLLTPSQPTTETANAMPAETQQPKRREAYRWASNLPIFAMAWSYKRYPNQRLRLACSSIRDGHELLKNTMSIVEFDEEHGELTERTQVFIGAPSCELKFIPITDSSQPDLIASATRELRIYSYHSQQQEIVLEAKMCPNKSFAYSGPLTSVDWNEVDPKIVGASSIDSTCTIWDIEAQESIAVVPPPPYTTDQQRLKYGIRTQLIAHERPVHDMAFSRLGNGKDYFASCGADASVRLFDLRNLKNSTILYEHPEKNKLNHISWNKMEPTQFVIVSESSNELVICDVRVPCRPLFKYQKHTKPVNTVDWAPHSALHFCSGSSDHEALIWQLHNNSEEPLLAYKSEGEITRIRWSSTYNNWIGISFANYLEILRV